MATTRSARAAAARAAARQLVDLPTDALGLVLYQLTLAHDIAAVAPTCHALCDAAKLARKLRPFSPEVVMLNGVGFRSYIFCRADGRPHYLRAMNSMENSMFGVAARACAPSQLQQINGVDWGLAMLNGVRVNTCRNVTTPSARCSTVLIMAPSSGLSDNDVLLCCVAALPDGVHFVVGLGRRPIQRRALVKLYHVDGTLVHTFKGHTGSVYAVAVTPDGRHIISGSDDKLVKVWNVASKSLVSTCAGHNQAVWSVAVMPDGQRILSGSCEVYHDTGPGSCQTAWIRMHRLDGTLVRRFSHHTSTAMALVPLPDNTHALSGSRDYTVKLFNVNDGAVLRTFNAAEHSREVPSVPGAAARRPPLRQRR